MMQGEVSMSSVKADAIRLIQALPDDCTWFQIEQLVVLNASIEQSEREFEAGLGIPHEQAVAEMESWLASLGPRQPSTSSKAS